MAKRKVVREKEKTPLSKLRQRIYKQIEKEPSIPEIEDLEHKISEDPKENSEGDIEQEEDAGQEPYQEIGDRMEHEDNPDDEDED